MVEYRQAAASRQWSCAEGLGFMFPRVLEGGEEEERASTPAQMTTNLQIHLWAAGMEDERYTMHFFRVRGAAIVMTRTARPWS